MDLYSDDVASSPEEEGRVLYLWKLYGFGGRNDVALDIGGFVEVSFFLRGIFESSSPNVHPMSSK
jgi:hypothetical protein